MLANAQPLDFDLLPCLPTLSGPITHEICNFTFCLTKASLIIAPNSQDVEIYHHFGHCHA